MALANEQLDELAATQPKKRASIKDGAASAASAAKMPSETSGPRSLEDSEEGREVREMIGKLRKSMNRMDHPEEVTSPHIAVSEVLDSTRRPDEKPDKNDDIPSIYREWEVGTKELDLILQWEPSVIKDGPGEINEEMACWILAIIGLTPENQRGHMRKRLANVLGYNVSQIGSISAYLTPALRARIKKGSHRYKVLEQLEELLNGKTESQDPWKEIEQIEEQLREDEGPWDDDPEEF